jgi:uncharacterized protein (TIGR03067 family)
MTGWFDFYVPWKGKGSQLVLTFTGDQFTAKTDEGTDYRVSGTFACDPTKSPKQITFTFTDRTGDHRVAAICSLSDESLRLCVGDNDEVPPQAFFFGPSRGRPAQLLFERPPAKKPNHLANR